MRGIRPAARRSMSESSLLCRFQIDCPLFLLHSSVTALFSVHLFLSLRSAQSNLKPLIWFLQQVRQQFLERLKTVVRIYRIAALETMFKYGIIKFKELIDAEFVILDLVHIMFYSLLVHADYFGCATVGDSVLL